MLGISSVNVNGLNEKNKRNTVLTHFANSADDICFLQDLKADSKNKIDKWLRKWDGPSYSACKDSSSSVVMLFKKNSDFQVQNVSEDHEGRFLLINGKSGDKDVTLCNIYAPSGPQHLKERRVFFEKLREVISAFKLEDSAVIMGGDFNCVTDINLDRSRVISKVDSSVNKLKEAINTFQLRDIWRHHNPDKKEFTFYSNVGTGSRLDRFYVTRNLTSNVIQSEINNFAHSDHNKITMKIDLSEIERGPGIWKINNAYLKDPKYVEQITHIWHQHRFDKNKSDNINGWWEQGKKLIKETSIKFSKKKTKERKAHKWNLLKQFRNIKNKLDKNPNNTRNKELYRKINDEIKSIEIQEAEGTKIRSKAQWREDGETSSGYFCSLEKKRGVEKSMRSVQRLKDGPMVTGTGDMLRETRQFYVDLYTEEGIEESAQDTMLNKIKSKLTDEQAQACEGKVSHDEIMEAVSQTQNDRSPGTDGLTYEFYKSFWHLVGKDLVEVFNYSFENKELPESQKYGLLTLLFKKGERALLSNWRPISLLNTDYKILAKALSVRLSGVLANIVSDEQTCGVPGRTILNNVFILRDLVVICKQKNIPAAIISIDQMKAFDRVNWSFTYKTLRAFGFKDTFVRWIQLLYNGAKSIVKVNGFLSEPFLTQRGVRQGGPPFATTLYPNS